MTNSWFIVTVSTTCLRCYIRGNNPIICHKENLCRFQKSARKSIRAKPHFLYVYTLTPTRLRRVGVSVVSSQHLLYQLAVHVGHMCDNGWTSGICRVYSTAYLSEESQNSRFYAIKHLWCLNDSSQF